jgi:asparagine synthase (glutamine-hydrolysing)
MCGLIFSHNVPISENNLQSALKKMAWRGPDATGTYQSGSFSFGHVRLTIIDNDPRATQPFFSLDRQWVIVYNGEIYNWRELAVEYKLEMRTTCDTEVILELWRLYGPDILNKLNGMFSFVIANLNTGYWCAVRDRLGVKPLFIARKKGGIIFASEPVSLLELLSGGTPDEFSIRQYKLLRSFFNGRTVWKEISSLPPGSIFDQQGMRPWWHLPKGKQSPPGDEELRATIESAVALRRVADVPVGSYLSGGLDSTIIAGLASQPDTWSVGFSNCNEFSWGRLAADRFGHRHHEILTTPEDFVSCARELIKIRQEPLSVPNEVLIYLMTTQVKKKNKVVLSGEGADELFGGYDRIFRWANTKVWDIKKFSELYSYGSLIDVDIIEDALTPFLDRGTAPDIVAAFFQCAHLGGLLRRLDSMTMLCGVEARTPFVDYRLIERLAGVSLAWKMEGNVVKAPLKRIFSDLVPKEIIERPKVGFPVPLSELNLGEGLGMSPWDRWFSFNLSVLFGTD